MAGVRDWAVTKLRDLNFEGDADALAAYVEALIENNEEYEGGDPEKLRVQATTELADFLGEAGAAVFVAGLVTHLSSRGPVAASASAAAARQPPPPGAAAAAAAASQPAQQDRAQRRERERERERERDRERDRADRDRGNRRPDYRDRDRDTRRGSVRAPARGAREEHPRTTDRRSLDIRDRNRTRDAHPPAPRRGPAPQGIDLRDTLSRRRASAGGPPPAPQKRPREEGGRSPGGPNASKHARVDSLPSGLPMPPLAGPQGAPGAPGAAPPGAPFPFPFMPPPAVLQAMANARPGGPPPDPAFLAGMFAAAAAHGGRGGRGGMRGSVRGGPRGGRGGRFGTERGGRVANGGASSAAGSTLVLQNVPKEKLNFMAINDYFQKFGTIVNIRLFPPARPSRAFLEFSNKSEAESAMHSVDAIMGNRHIKLNWARDSDYDENAPAGRHPVGVRQHLAGKTASGPSTTDAASAMATAPAEPPVDHEADLQRKREAIVKARAEELRLKAERQATHAAAIAEQKELFAKLGTGASNAEKKEVLKRLKELNEVIARVQEESKPQRVAPAAAEEKPWMKRFRPAFQKTKSYSLDNRPKVVRILNAKDGISADAAASIFRDTERAESDNGCWILHFSTRAAAESALRAAAVLKRGFGPSASAQIIKFNPVAQPFVPVGAQVAVPPAQGTMQQPVQPTQATNTVPGAQ